MRKGKVGAPFEYLELLDFSQAIFIKIGFKHRLYKFVQGIVRGLSDYIRIEKIKCILHILGEEYKRSNHL